jgi:dUTP pyrophosphatase
MIKIKLGNGAKELTRGSEYATGLDLKARGICEIIKNDKGQNKIGDVKWFNDEFKEYKIKPFQRLLVRTGVYIQPDNPEEYNEGLIIFDATIRNRSGLTLKDGILCQLGTIDIDYRNDLGLSIINLSNEDFVIKEDMTLGQLCFGYAVIPKVKYVDELEETKRGIGGFGSTDKKEV